MNQNHVPRAPILTPQEKAAIDRVTQRAEAVRVRYRRELDRFVEAMRDVSGGDDPRPPPPPPPQSIEGDARGQ